MITEPIAIIAQQYPRVVVPLIDAALESVDAIVFDWRFYPTQPGNPVSLFNQAMARAVRRGVEVRALVANAGVVDSLKKHGVDAKQLHTKKLLHTKMLIFDKTKIVLGSHNFTQSAFALNEEASILCEMPDTENDFVKYFRALWGL